MSAVIRRLLGPGWVTLAVAGAVVASVLGVGFLLQRTVLPAPSPARLAALRAGVWLERYRLVDSTITLDGGRVVHGRCLQDWFGTGVSRRRGAVLRLDDGYVLLAVPPHTLTSTGGTPATRATSPLVLMELAGCPRVLARRLQTLAQRTHGLTLENERLHFWLKATHVTLTLDARSHAPVAVKLVARGVEGASQLRFTPVTTRLRELLGVSGR
ncbi:MAG TPA: hypothetical protein VGG88_01305 [Gaiellaceae bacterium]